MRLRSAIVVVLGVFAAGHRPAERPSSLILQGRSAEHVAAAVRGAGGTVTHDLSIIRAVAADLTPSQLARAQREGAITRVFEERVASGEFEGAVDRVEVDPVNHRFCRLFRHRRHSD